MRTVAKSSVGMHLRGTLHICGVQRRENSAPAARVLDRDSPQLMSNPERHYTYFAQVAPPIVEALLIPFHVAGEAVGTVWVIAHDASRRFDAEDLRIMNILGEFAAATYQVQYPDAAFIMSP